MIKILIADDHAVVRQGLKQILSETSDMMVEGEAQNGQEVLRKVRTGHWDVIVLDITLSDRSGLDILNELKRECPKVPVLVLSMHPEEQFAMRVLKSGASGYMTKESAPDELVKAIRKVAAGGKYVSQRVTEMFLFNIGNDFEKPSHESLSDREYRVMCLIASGKTVKEIAKELSLSVKTISTHRTRILRKMKMTSNAELIRYGIQNRLVD